MQTYQIANSNLLDWMFPASGGVRALNRTNYKSLLGVGIDFDAIGFSSIMDSEALGPVQITFDADISMLSSMNLTNSEILSLINENKISFIWSFDDPYWEDYTTDLEYTNDLKNSNIIFNYELSQVTHTYYRSGIYFAKLMIIYNEYKLEFVKRLQIGSNKIGIYPASNKTYKTQNANNELENLNIEFESFNGSDKIYYYKRRDNELLEIPGNLQFTIYNKKSVGNKSQTITTSAGEYIYYAHYSLANDEMIFVPADELTGYENIKNVEIYYSPETSGFSLFNNDTIPFYDSSIPYEDDQYVSYTINREMPAKKDFILYDNRFPVELESFENEAVYYDIYYYGSWYNFKTNSWESLLDPNQEIKSIFYILDNIKPTIEWHYQDLNTPSISAINDTLDTTIPLTGANFINPFDLKLALVNHLGETIPGTIYYNYNTDPLDNLFEGSTIYTDAVPIYITSSTSLYIRGISTIPRDDNSSHNIETDLIFMYLNKSY